MAYVYRHIRLDKNEPFYVGIGKNDDNLKRSKSKYERNNLWKKVVAKSEYEIEIMMIGLTWEEACQKEQEFITLYGRMDLSTGTLTNLTGGGEGFVAQGPRSVEHCQKMSECKKGEKHVFWGTHRSEETKKKIAAARLGKRHTEAMKQKLSEERRGIKQPRELVERRTKKQRIPVVQLTTEGLLVKVWDSATTAAKTMNYASSNISTTCRGKYKTYKGFRWVYLKDYNK